MDGWGGRESERAIDRKGGDLSSKVLTSSFVTLVMQYNTIEPLHPTSVPVQLTAATHTHFTFPLCLCVSFSFFLSSILPPLFTLVVLYL